MNKNVLMEIMKDVQTDINNYDLTKAILKMQEIDREYFDGFKTDGYISDDRLNEIVRESVENGDSWRRIACLLTDIVNRQCDDMYEEEGDGNITWIKKDSVQCTYDDLLDMIRDMED